MHFNRQINLILVATVEKIFKVFFGKMLLTGPLFHQGKIA